MRSAEPKAEDVAGSEQKGLRVAYPAGPYRPPAPAPTTLGYRLRAVAVLVLLLLFVGIYLACVAGSAYLVYQSIALPWGGGGSGRGAVYLVILRVGLVVAAGMLFLLMVKGLFHRRRVDNRGMVEVTKKDQPELFAFIERVAADAGTRLPGRVYLSFEVNAGVFYPRSILSLVLPVKKQLVLGLGLVATLDVTEFKAVLAHEFGHYAQASMRLGHYLYVVAPVIGDLVYGRDAWDRFLLRWRSADLRLSIPAWILSGVVWVLRGVLKLVFQLVGLASQSLRRQMEFDADLAAVRLAGSDAIVSSLWKAERGAIAFAGAVGALRGAAEHHKFSNDVFFELRRSLATLDDRLKKDPKARAEHAQLLARYEPGPALHFTSPEKQVASLWEGHPPIHEREANVKRVYVDAPSDRRSAWLLLRGQKALCAELSRALYGALGFEAKKLLAAEKIAELIDEERGEMRQDPRYRGAYENRRVDPGDVAALAAELDEAEARGELDVAALREAASKHTGARLQKRMERLAALDAEVGIIASLEAGTSPLHGERVEFRGAKRSTPEILRLRNEVQTDLAELFRKLARFDRAVFRYHYGRADAAARAELLARHVFLGEVQDLLGKVGAYEGPLGRLVSLLTTRTELQADEVERMRKLLSAVHDALLEARRKLAELEAPPLAMIGDHADLARFVFPDGLVEPLATESIAGRWISELLSHYEGGLRRLRKLHYKNLGALLALGERLDPELFPALAPEEAAADDSD